MKLQALGRVLAALLLAVLTSGIAAPAAEPSPVGRWTTVSDKTGKPQSIVEISEHNGEYVGHIVRLLARSADTLCTECKDERKDKPLVGMLLMDGLHAEGDEYTGGHIVDPDDGAIYKVKIKVIDGGARLQVRGFIGFALLGRTQTWLRDSESAAAR